MMRWTVGSHVGSLKTKPHRDLHLHKHLRARSLTSQLNPVLWDLVSMRHHLVRTNSKDTETQSVYYRE